MKIVNLETFLKLPSGTLFIKRDYCAGLCIKEESIHESNDFFYMDTTDAIECEGDIERERIFHTSELTGKSFNMDFETGMRDGAFDDDQMFMIFENKDVIELINKLKECKKNIDFF